MARVADTLGIAWRHREWLTTVAGLEPEEAALPSPSELPAIFDRLAIPEVDRRSLLHLYQMAERPEARWLLDRCHHLLSSSMGRPGELSDWPELSGEFGRYFYVYVYLATLAEVRQFHIARGIPDDVAWATLADLGQHLAVYRANRGVGGLHSRPWMTLHFRGILYSLGRLQFNMFCRPEAGPDGPIHAGEWLLGVHIPETGPLSPTACDESFRRASYFFPQHFPEHLWRHAVCTSWLLDRQLASYLPANSNIVAFQQRFESIGEARTGDSAVLEFVFHHEDDVSLADLPQQTSLERAVVRHLRSGRHWQVVSGFVDLEQVARGE